MATGEGGSGGGAGRGRDEDRGPQWVIGLDGTQKLEESEKTEQLPDGEGGGGKRRDWLVLVAILVGVVIGVGTWWVLLGGPEEAPPVEYTVEAGDTLWKIAQGHGVTVGQLREWNELSGDTIEVGQVLLIHTGAPDAAASGTRTAPRAAAGPSAPRPEGPADDGRLHMPSPKPCLTLDPDAAFEAEGDEPTMVASAGLSPDQVRGSTRPFLSELQRCFRPGVPVSGTAVLQVTVGCDGLVSGVVVTDGGGLPPEELSCIKETVGYAPFPAHDMPDGYTFSWPISLEWPG